MSDITIAIQLTGDWEKLLMTLDPRRFQKALRAEVRRANAVSCMRIAAEMRSRIKSRQFEANADLTTIIKGSDTPLVDHGNFWKAITHVTPTWNQAFVGVLYKTATRGRFPVANLAEMLHGNDDGTEGTLIRVTPRMRKLFMVLFLYTKRRIYKKDLTGRAKELAKRLKPGRDEIYPLTKPFIYIPPRPWVYSVMTDTTVLEMIRKNWEMALERAIRGTAQP